MNFSRSGRPRRQARVAWILTLAAALSLLCTACAADSIGQTTAEPPATSPAGTPAGGLPHFDHIVVVVEENHSYDDIVSSAEASYINSLAAQSALFTNAHAVTHPSEPNYLALYAGSTFGLASDACPQKFTAPNLGSEAIAAGLTFTGYSESMPQAGYTSCTAGDLVSAPYARKHNPWVDFADVPTASNQPFTSWPQDFVRLPSIAFVVPNQLDDMHSGSIADGDAWLQQHLDAYVRWAPAHNSLLILTWDEDDGSAANHIVTLFAGAHVVAGRYGETINHYRVLHTIEALDGLPFTGNVTSTTPITDIWHA